MDIPPKTSTLNSNINNYFLGLFSEVLSLRCFQARNIVPNCDVIIFKKILLCSVTFEKSLARNH